MDIFIDLVGNFNENRIERGDLMHSKHRISKRHATSLNASRTVKDNTINMGSVTTEYWARSTYNTFWNKKKKITTMDGIIRNSMFIVVFTYFFSRGKSEKLAAGTISQSQVNETQEDTFRRHFLPNVAAGKLTLVTLTIYAA